MRQYFFSIATLKHLFSTLLRRLRRLRRRLPGIIAADDADMAEALKSTLRGNDQRVAQYHAFAQDTAKQGISDGIHDIPEENAASSQAEESIAIGYDYATTQVKQLDCIVQGQIQNHLAQAHGLLADKIAIKENAVKDLEPAKNKALAKADRQISLRGLRWLRRQRESVKGMVAVLNEHLRHWGEIRDHIEILYQHLHVEVYHRMPPVRRWFDHFMVFWGVVAVLVCLEILVNFTAFQNIGAGDNNLASLGLGIFFALCQAWSAENLGSALCQKQHRKASLFLVLTVVFCGFIMFSRLNMEEENPITHLLYWVINAVFAALTAVLAYFHAKHHDFFSLQQRRKKVAERLEKTRYRIEQLELAYQKRCEAIETEFKTQVAAAVYESEAEVTQRIAQYELWLSQLEAHEHRWLEQLNVARQNALSRYRHLNEEARRNHGHPPVKRWQHVLLPPARNAAAILLLLGCFLSGCSAPRPHTHLWGFYDQTDTTHTQEIEPMLDYILSFAIHDTLTTEWGEVTIHLSPIDETSTPKTVTLHLPASEPFWLRNEQKHRHHLRKFREDLRHALVALTAPGTGTHRSYIHRNFHHALQSLSHYHGTRIVLSWSDLILNEPEVSFYSYRSHPEKIMEHRDSLIHLMTKDYPLSDLTGVKLINIHHAAPLHDELHEATKRYFHHYWTSLGMEVEFKTNLPLAHEFAVER